MAEPRKVILVGKLGPSYTNPGENERVVKNKAYIFSKTNKARRENQPLVKPADVTDNDAWVAINDFYDDRDKTKWADLLEDAGFDLLLGSEGELKDILVDEFFTSGKREIHSKSTIAGYVSDIRGMFRSIGREHDAAGGQVYDLLSSPLVNSANPMTTALENNLKDRIEQPTQTTKTSAPASVAVGFIIMINYLQDLILALRRFGNGLNDPSRLENLTNLVLIMALSLHEGGPRSIEVMHFLNQEHLFLPLHKKVYMIALAFIKPSTLAYLLTNNKISYFVAGLHKGKDMQIDVWRLKPVIPVAYNSLDFLTIFTVCMRTMLDILPEKVNNPKSLVFKQNLNISSLRSRIALPEFKDFALRAFRYAAAEEDKRFNIFAMWTRMRMGHKPTSNTKDRYAHNPSKDGKGKRRVICDGEELPLGSDLVDFATNVSEITLECKIVGINGSIVYDKDWLTKAFASSFDPDAPSTSTAPPPSSAPPKGAMEDFNEVVELTTKWIEQDCDESFEALMERFNSQPDGWWNDVPLGFNFNFRNGLVSEKLQSIYDDVLKGSKDYKNREILGLEGLFAAPTPPRVIPEIWSLPQVVYGNFRGMIGGVVERAPLARQPPVRQPLPSIPEDEDDDEVPDSPYEWDGTTFADLERGDFVVLKCDMPNDYAALKLPECEGLSNDIRIWVAKMDTLKILKSRKRASFRGRFFSNPEHDATLPLTIAAKAESIIIEETTIIWLYENDGTEEFSFSKANIKEIQEFLKSHIW